MFAGVSFHQPVSISWQVSVAECISVLPPLRITTCRYHLSVLPPVVTVAYDCNNNVLLYCYLTQTAKRRGVGWADSRGDACLQFKARQFKVGALMFQLNHRFSQYTTLLPPSS